MLSFILIFYCTLYLIMKLFVIIIFNLINLNKKQCKRSITELNENLNKTLQNMHMLFVWLYIRMCENGDLFTGDKMNS